MISKLGSVEQYKEYMQLIASKGGKARVAKGYSDPRNAGKRRFGIKSLIEG